MIQASSSARGLRNRTIQWKNIVDDYGAVPDGATNNLTPFNSWRAWALEQEGWVGLKMPAGNYAITGTFSNAGPYPMALSPFNGIKKLVVVGYGAVVNVFGSAVSNTAAGRALIHTVDAGEDTIELIDPDDAALFIEGAMALVAGLDLMGYGYPPNPHFFEWVRIQSIDGANITFDRPLKYGYKENWPNYFMGHGFELGGIGAASIVRTIPEWDVEHVLYGLSSGNYSGQVYSFLRKMTLFDVKSIGHGWVMGACEDHKIISQDHSATLMEVDKLTSRGLLENYGPAERAIVIQSSSVDEMHVKGGTRTINGTARHMLVTGGTRTSINLGPIAYGISDEIIIRDAEVTTGIGGTPGMGVLLNEDLTYEGDGVFRYTGDLPPQWLLPGAVGIIATANPFYKHSPFRVLSVESDGGEIGDPVLIQTTLAGSELPAVVGVANTNLLRHSAPNLTVINCTGCPSAEELSLVPPNSPYGMFRRRTLNGLVRQNLLGFTMGRLVHVKFNVTQAYTGVASSLVCHLGGWLLNVDMEPIAPGAYVNLKVTGERIVTPEGVTGTQSGDANLAGLTGGIWLPYDQGFAFYIGRSGDYAAVNISGEDPSVWPSVTVEILTDQEF